MSHPPLSLQSKQKKSPLYLFSRFWIVSWKCSKDACFIVLRKQSISCSHHITFTLIFSAPFGLIMFISPACRKHWKRVTSSSHENSNASSVRTDGKGLEGCCAECQPGKITSSPTVGHTSVSTDPALQGPWTHSAYTNSSIRSGHNFLCWIPHSSFNSMEKIISLSNPFCWV